MGRFTLKLQEGALETPRADARASPIHTANITLTLQYFYSRPEEPLTSPRGVFRAAAKLLQLRTVTPAATARARPASRLSL
jgi:hypothetical protein